MHSESNEGSSRVYSADGSHTHQTQSGLTELEQERLLKEYEINVQLWFQPDMLRQSRMQNLLTITAGLLGVLGAVLALKPEYVVFATVAVVYSVFGIVSCLAWHRTFVRNDEYVRLHRYQLRHVERQLSGLSTFEHIWLSLYDFLPLNFGQPIGTFAPRSRMIIHRSAMTEVSFPILILLFWLIMGVSASTYLLLFSWT